MYSDQSHSIDCSAMIHSVAINIRIGSIKSFRKSSIRVIVVDIELSPTVSKHWL